MAYKIAHDVVNETNVYGCKAVTDFYMPHRKLSIITLILSWVIPM